jgi:hypothetical protein
MSCNFKGLQAQALVRCLGIFELSGCGGPVNWGRGRALSVRC